MATIYIIDDDAASELLADHLRFRGHNAKRIKSAGEALANVQEIAASDLAILDLVMPLGTPSHSEADGERSSGMVVYRTLRDLSKTLPILIYTANQDQSLIDVIESDFAASYVPRWSGPSLSEFVVEINRLIGRASRPWAPQAFIVHGHDEVAKLTLKNYIQNTLHLPEPIILHEQPNQGKTLIEKFEGLAEAAELIFVLLTPDDIVGSATDSDSAKRRARQNVILELGYFLGHFGRSSGRVFLLFKGPLELPSDISGLTYIDIEQGIESAGEAIRREVNSLRG